MSLPLEDKIMQDIGFGQHYNWYNGSGSCQYTRLQAMQRLQGAIYSAKSEGQTIALLTHNLAVYALQVAASEPSQYELTASWQVASYIIAFCIRLATDETADPLAFERQLRQRYPVNDRMLRL